MKDVAEGAAESEEAEEAEEAEAAPKKKGRKPRASAAADDAGSAAAAAAAAPSTGVSQRGRERKAVQSFVPPTPTKLAKEEFVIEDGQGTPLGDIENIKRRMDTINAQDDILKACFLACYPTWKGRGGNTKDVIKKNLRAFSGYVKGQEKELAEKATERLERYHGDVLKHVCALLDISESGSKAKMIEHITTFLQNPKSSGHAYKGGSVGTKRKSASITKKGGKADDSVRSTCIHRKQPHSCIIPSALHVSRVRNDFVLSGRLASAIVHSFHRECCRQFFLMSHSLPPSSTCSARIFGWFCR
jgi:hypothetical protein